MLSHAAPPCASIDERTESGDPLNGARYQLPGRIRGLGVGRDGRGRITELSRFPVVCRGAILPLWWPDRPAIWGNVGLIVSMGGRTVSGHDEKNASIQSETAPIRV